MTTYIISGPVLQRIAAIHEATHLGGVRSAGPKSANQDAMDGVRITIGPKDLELMSVNDHAAAVEEFSHLPDTVAPETEVRLYLHLRALSSIAHHVRQWTKESKTRHYELTYDESAPTLAKLSPVGDDRYQPIELVDARLVTLNFPSYAATFHPDPVAPPVEFGFSGPYLAALCELWGCAIRIVRRGRVYTLQPANRRCGLKAPDQTVRAWAILMPVTFPG